MMSFGKSGLLRAPGAKAFALLALCLCLFAPTLALAAGPFTPPDDDLSKRVFIDYLFGPLTNSGQSSLLTPLVQVFNGGILILGGIFIAYTIIAGTMSTAHDGEVLGRKWSTMWVPVRTVLGAGAVMPVIGSGWCVAQAIVVWLALQGIGLADGVWDKAVDGMRSAGNMTGFYSAPGIDTPVRKMMASMFLANVCVNKYNQVNGSLREELGDTLNMTRYQATRVPPSATNGSGYIYGFVENGIPYGDPDSAVCGIVTLRAPMAREAPVDEGDSLSPHSRVGADLVNMAAFDAGVIAAHHDALDAAQGSMDALSRDYIVSNNNADAAARINAATATYVQEVSTRAQQTYNALIDQNPSFMELMRQDGWVMAGAFYMKISKMQDAITQAVTAVPGSGTPGDYARIPDEQRRASNWFNGVDVRNLYAWGNTPKEVADAINKATSVSRSVMTQNGGGSTLSQTVSGEDGEWGSAIVSWFTRNWVFSDIYNNNLSSNPVLMAKNIGTSMTSWAWGALLGGAVGSAVGTVGLGGGVTGVGPVIATMLSQPLFLLFSALLVPGVMLSTYLPLLPYVLWIGVVLGWAILLIEAVIAAPLWAVVHMAPDADGVVGRGGQGYMLVLSLTLRPALMVTGLVVAIVLMTPIGYLINSTFLGVFSMSVTTGGLGSLTQSIAGCVLYAVIMFSVINRVFALIHVIPDRILRWIGGGGNELSAEAEGINQYTTAKAVAGVGVMLGASQALGNASANLGQYRERQRAMAASQKGADEQKVGNAGSRMHAADSEATRAQAAAQANPESQFLQGEAAMRALDQRDAAQGAAVAQAELSSRTGSSKQREIAASFMQEHQQASEGGPAAMGAFLQRWNDRANGPDGRHMPFQGAIRNMALANSRLANAESRQADTGNASAVKSQAAWTTSGGGGSTGGSGGPDGTDDGGGAPDGGGSGGGGAPGGGGSGGGGAPGGGGSGGGPDRGVDAAVARPDRRDNPLERVAPAPSRSSASGPGSTGAGSSSASSPGAGLSDGAGQAESASPRSPDSREGGAARREPPTTSPGSSGYGALPAVTMEEGDTPNRRRAVGGRDPSVVVRGDLED